MIDPFRPADDEARALAQDLLGSARFAALGTLTDTGAPMVTRVAFGLGDDNAVLSLVSRLSHHTAALEAAPDCSLLIGEPGQKGDPLTHPRLTLQARAQLIPHGAPAYARMAPGWLKTHPKAKLYIGFTDFCFVRFTVSEGHLNGGFGKAYRLTPGDMAL